MRTLILLLLLSGRASAQEQRIAYQSRPFDPPNIVLINLDDLGVEKVAAYGEGPPGVAPPCTPTLDHLANTGLLFRNVWSNPTCSASRAQVLTGRHGFRTGMGRHINTSAIPEEPGLGVALELTLPEVLNGYETAAIGKWHLGGRQDVNGNGQGLQHPLNTGFDSFAGCFSNLQRPALPDPFFPDPGNCPAPRNYDRWIKTAPIPGGGMLAQSCSDVYATRDTVDDAVHRVETMRSPWFLYVAFNSAHTPIHDPPTGYPPGTCAFQHWPSLPTDPEPFRFNAMVESMDQELGRMLAGIYSVDPRALVIVISDNGTSQAGGQGTPGGCYDPMRSKSTLYESGVRVPLIVNGPGVVQGENDQPVMVTDLFATIAELAGNPVAAEDSISIVPYLRGEPRAPRNFLYAEMFQPNMATPDHPSTPPFQPEIHTRAIRNARYKLIRHTELGGTVEEELYDLLLDPCETQDLCSGPGTCPAGTLTPEQRMNYRELRDELLAMGVY